MIFVLPMMKKNAKNELNMSTSLENSLQYKEVRLLIIQMMGTFCEFSLTCWRRILRFEAIFNFNNVYIKHIIYVRELMEQSDLRVFSYPFIFIGRCIWDIIVGFQNALEVFYSHNFKIYCKLLPMWSLEWFFLYYMYLLSLSYH